MKNNSNKKYGINKWYIFSVCWCISMIVSLIIMIPYLDDSTSILILIPILGISFGGAFGLQKANPKAWREA